VDKKRTAPLPPEQIAASILMLRGQRAILDAERFPEDFMFRLSRSETVALNWSQFVTSSQKHRDPRFPPFSPRSAS